MFHNVMMSIANIDSVRHLTEGMSDKLSLHGKRCMGKRGLNDEGGDNSGSEYVHMELHPDSTNPWISD